MHYSHTLTEHHQDFLNQNRTDPITGEKIEEGHTIVVCAACKSAFFIESWEYLGHSHCDQTETLKFLPLPQTLYLKANDKYTQEVLTFGFATSPMFISDNEGCGLSIVGGFFSIVLSGMIGAEVDEIVGLIIFFILFGACLNYGVRAILPARTKNKSIKEMENMEAKLGVCIDYKLRGLTIKNTKTEDVEEFFDFADMTEFKYHIIYHPNTSIDALYCQLQIRIMTQQGFSIDYFATLHRDTIPEWSNFISKLPTDLRIINTPFVYELG